MPEKRREHYAAVRGALLAAGEFLSEEYPYPLWFVLSESKKKSLTKPGVWEVLNLPSEAALRTALAEEGSDRHLVDVLREALSSSTSEATSEAGDVFLLKKKFSGMSICLALGNVARAESRSQIAAKDYPSIMKAMFADKKVAGFLLKLRKHCNLPTAGSISLELTERFRALSIEPHYGQGPATTQRTVASCRSFESTRVLAEPRASAPPVQHFQQRQQHDARSAIEGRGHVSAYKHPPHPQIGGPAYERTPGPCPQYLYHHPYNNQVNAFGGSGFHAAAGHPNLVSPPSDNESAFFDQSNSGSDQFETGREIIQPTYPPWKLTRTTFKTDTVTENGIVQELIVPKTHRVVNERHYQTLIEKAAAYDNMRKNFQKKKFSVQSKDNLPHRLMAAVMAKYASIVSRGGEQLVAVWSYVLINYIVGFSLPFDQCMKISPSSSWLESVVDELATDQTLVAGIRIAKAEAVFFSTDHGDHGACIKRLFFHEKHELKDYLLDVDTSGKKGKDIAVGFRKSLRKLGLEETFRFAGQTTDSGGGQLDELAFQMIDEGVAAKHALYFVGPCMVHNMQSTIREPIKQYLGEGGLSQRTALQVLHSLYDLQKCMGLELFADKLEASWHHWCESQELGDLAFPKRLKHSIQAPILSRWWTVGSASKLTAEFWDFLWFFATTVCKCKTTAASENMIASGLYSLMGEKLIQSDNALLATLHDEYLNDHFEWFQGMDAEVGVPGFLAGHVLSRCFLISCDLADLGKPLEHERHQSRGKNFQRFIQSVEDLEDDDPYDPEDGCDGPIPELYSREQKQQYQREKFQKLFACVSEYFAKHTEKYTQFPLILLGVFGESAPAKVCADFLLGKEFDSSMVGETYTSAMHQREVHLQEYRAFLHDRCGDPSDIVGILEGLREEEKVAAGILKALDAVSAGFDIWNDTDPGSTTNEHREFGKRFIATMPTTNHDTERFVKTAKYVAKTGRKELKRSLYAIATNGLSTSEQEEEVVVDEEDGDQRNNEPERRVKVKRGADMGLFIFEYVRDLCQEVATIKAELGDAEFSDRRNRIKALLTEKEESTLVYEQKNDLEEFIDMLCTDKDPNKRMNEKGYSFTPATIGKVRFSDLRSKVHKGSLEEELAFRHVVLEPVAGKAPTYTQLKTKLQELELAERQESGELVPDLSERRKQTNLYNDKGLPKHFTPRSAANFLSPLD